MARALWLLLKFKLAYKLLPGLLALLAYLGVIQPLEGVEDPYGLF